MDRYKETFETWNKLASLYEEKFMHLDLYNASYYFICHSMQKKQAKILDIGCGPGNITKYLLTERPDFDIFGIDISPNMIEIAKKNNPTANFAIMDIRNIDNLKEKYDVIVCGFCVPYLSQKEAGKLISDSYQLLNENGLMYISFVEGNPTNSGFRVAGSGNRSYFYYHSLSDLKSALLQNNFEDLHIFKVDYKKSDSEIELHTILTVRKK